MVQSVSGGCKLDSKFCGAIEYVPKVPDGVAFQANLVAPASCTLFAAKRVRGRDEAKWCCKISFSAPEFKFEGNKVFTYAEAAANVAKPISASEVQTYRGCREFTQLTIETYFSAGSI